MSFLFYSQLPVGYGLVGALPVPWMVEVEVVLWVTPVRMVAVEEVLRVTPVKMLAEAEVLRVTPVRKPDP